MAKAKKDPAVLKGKKKSEGGSKKGSGKLTFYSCLLVAMLAAPFMFPTVVLILVGLIPSLVAFVMDKDHDHPGAIAVAAMNCAGLSPFVIDLWLKGQTMDNAFQIMGDANNWLIILGSAAIGQVIATVVPQAIATLTVVHSEMRVKTLKQNMEMLKNSWGPEVGTIKPMEKMIH